MKTSIYFSLRDIMRTFLIYYKGRLRRPLFMYYNETGWRPLFIYYNDRNVRQFYFWENGGIYENSTSVRCRKAELVCDSRSYIILRGYWCRIISLNLNALCADKVDSLKNIFCEEIGRVFVQRPRYKKEHLVGLLQCESGQGRYLQTNERERKFTKKLVMIMAIE